MIKRIVSLFIVLCLLISLFCVTASASYIYEVDKSAVLMSSSPLIVSDSGISTAAVEPSDLDDYLSAVYKSYNRTVAELLAIIAGYLDVSDSSFVQLGDAVYTVSQLFGDLNDSLLVGITQSYLDRYGSISRSSLGLGGFIVDGIMGLAVKIDNAVTSINSSLNIVNTSVVSLQSALLTQLETRLGEIYVNSDNTETSSSTVKPRLSFILRNGILALNRTLTLNQGESFLLFDSSQSSVATSKARLSYLVSQGFLGLGNLLQVDPNEDFLRNNGVKDNIGNSSGRLSWLIREGFLGLSSNIIGSEFDNIYTSTLYDNNNSTTTVNSVGLGPLLNTQLSNIGENLGHLAYIFASDDDIKLKEDSQSLVDATDSFFDDSDTNVKVSADNIGSLKDYVGQASDILDTNTDADDIFTVVSNENSWLWFSSETAADLNTVPVTVAELDEDIYNSGFAEQLYADFYDTYFPDR